MREGLLCVLLLWIMCGCGENKRGKVELKDLSFQCKITEPQIGEKLLLEINGKEQAFPVPADGVVDIKVPRIVPQYSSVTYGRKYYPLYLMGGGLMQMEFSGDLDNWRRTFSGNGKEINEYLSSSIIPFESSDFVKNENDLKEVTEKLFAQNIKNLESRKLPKSFENLERERLRYYAYGSWNSYRLNHRWMVGDENFEPSDAYYATMRELGKEKPELRELEIYRKFLRNTVEVMVNRGRDKVLRKNSLKRRLPISGETIRIPCCWKI